MKSHDALAHRADGIRSEEDGKIVRLQARTANLPKEFAKGCKEIGMASVITTVHDDYFMFVKLNYKMPASPTDRGEAAKAEQELRRRQTRAIELIRKWIPGCEKAFITRTSPSLCIRRGRLIQCDYDITRSDVLDARHFEDDIMAYGFHDNAPRLQIRDGGTYGTPYRALCPTGIDNLLVAGMLITADHDAHMSTRNTVCCMGQGQAAGTAAALCADRGFGTRNLAYGDLRDALVQAGVHLEN